VEWKISETAKEAKTTLNSAYYIDIVNSYNKFETYVTNAYKIGVESYTGLGS
jgi:hypothetical protein